MLLIFSSFSSIPQDVTLENGGISTVIIIIIRIIYRIYIQLQIQVYILKDSWFAYRIYCKDFSSGSFLLLCRQSYLRSRYCSEKSPPLHRFVFLLKLLVNVDSLLLFTAVAAALLLQNCTHQIYIYACVYVCLSLQTIPR